MDYFDITKTKLIIPELWKKDSEQALKKSDEELVIILKAQIRLANQLKDIEDDSFTFSRAAWLCLWTKLFNIADGINGALQSNSETLMDILDRMFFECQLQILTIIGPEENTNKVERLNAYSAWSLYNDLGYQDTLLRKSTMDGIWNIEDEKAILEASQDEQIYHEMLFGPIDKENLTTDYREAAKQKISHQSQEYKKRDRIEKWLKHEDIQPWIKKIKSLRNHWAPAFYQLFDEQQSSIPKVLKSLNFTEQDMEFTYVLYKQASMAIHGSSFLNNFNYNSEAISPKFTGDSDTVVKRAVCLGKGIYNIGGIALLILKKSAWPDKTNSS